MSDTRLFLPLLTLIGWTFCVLLVIPYRRFKAAFAGRVTAEDFCSGESDKVPPDVSIPNRAFMNLLEAPLLFYVVCLVAFVTGNVVPASIALAWGYVALRVLHSLVYLTYNRVLHRFAVFAASNLVLAALWLQLTLTLLR